MKRFLAIVLAVCMAFGFCVNVHAVEYGKELENAPSISYKQTFSDVPKSFWAFEYIAEMVSRGVLSGYPDGKFYPDSQVTRAEFAKIMTMAVGFSVAEPTRQIFEDVKTSDWYAPYVHTAKEYLSAYEHADGKYYMPDSPALREDIAVALVKLKGYSTVGADMTMITRMFSDYQSISADAQIYVAAAVENGLISGYSDGTFRGQNGITRAEAATLLWRAYQYGNANKVYDTSETKKETVKVSETQKEETKETVKETKKEEVKEAEEPEEKKAYVMTKLASADSISATYDDDDTIYYIDAEDDNVYEISISGGKKSKFFDCSDLSYEVVEEQEVENVEEVTETIAKTVETGEFEEIEEEIVKEVVTTETEEVVVEEYTDFVPRQVYYDNVNDRLLLVGYYTNFNKAFSKSKEIEYTAIYDITNKKEKIIIEPFEYLYTSSYLNNRILFGEKALIKAVLDNNRIVLSEHYYGSSYIIDTDNSKNVTEMDMDFDGVSGMKYGSNIYSLGGIGLYKYDFNEGKGKRISDKIEFNSFSTKKDCYYFLNNGEIFKISVKNGKTTELDINTKSENVEFEDMGNMSGIDERFYVVDDSAMIFYDNTMKSFRMLTKN